MATALFCLRDELLGKAQQLKRDLGWTGPVIGMHIRRGDRKDLHKYSVNVRHL
jgi:hypothetical protein